MNYKELKSIDIVFENCEVCNVPAKCIQWFYISEFRRSMVFQSPNDVFEHEIADFIKLHLINLDQISESNFGYEFVSRMNAYNDITHLDFNYEDGTNYYLGVAWGGDSDYINEYQYVKIDKDKYTNQEVMYIMFSKEKPIDWNKEEEGII